MTHDATHKIVDVLLTLIFRQGLRPCRHLFCPQRLPIRWLWVHAAAQLLNHTRCNTQHCWHSIDALFMLYWCSVDALFMLCWRSVDTHCQVQRLRHQWCCLYRRRIGQLLINSVAKPLDDSRCNTHNRWCSVDAHFQTGAVTMSPYLLPIKAANTLIIGKCCSTALGLYKMQYPRLLMLCWHSVDALLMLSWCSVDALLMVCWRSLWGEVTSTLTILPIKATNTSIMDKSHCTAHGWHKMQHTKSLTLCWRSFSVRGCGHVAVSFAHKVCQYVDYG